MTFSIIELHLKNLETMPTQLQFCFFADVLPHIEKISLQEFHNSSHRIATSAIYQLRYQQNDVQDRHFPYDHWHGRR